MGNTKDHPYSFGGTNHPGFAKVVEEQGELLQVIGKIMMVGGRFEHWSGNQRKPLHEELADVSAAIDFYVQSPENMSFDDFREFHMRKQMKLEKFFKWHEEGEDLPE